jgi:transposase-like protein
VNSLVRVLGNLQALSRQTTLGPADSSLDVIAGMLALPVPPSRSCSATQKRTCWPSPPSPSRTPKLIWSTNPLERLNKEIKRRTDVVG